MKGWVAFILWLLNEAFSILDIKQHKSEVGRPWRIADCEDLEEWVSVCLTEILSDF